MTWVIEDHHEGHDQTCHCWLTRPCGCYLWDQDCPNYEPIYKEITMEPNIAMNHSIDPEGSGYHVELGGQNFTQAQWEALLPYMEGRERYAAGSLQRMVKEFHEGMGQPVGRWAHPLPARRVAVRVELIREEFEDELIPALLARDMVETADACIDILYVTLGLLVEMGIDAQPLFEEVQRSNMSKLGADGQPIIAGHNDPDGVFPGRVKKGPNYFRPNLKAIIDSGAADLR